MLTLNKVILIGNLGRDPEIRSLGNGDEVAGLSIATTEKWKDARTGERRERTEWHRVQVFGGLVKVIRDYCRKGDSLYLEGQIRTRKWTGQDGRDNYTTEVVLSGPHAVLKLGGSPRRAGAEAPAEAAAPAPEPGLDDEIPF